jgi:hypothetical protein
VEHDWDLDILRSNAASYQTEKLMSYCEDGRSLVRDCAQKITGIPSMHHSIQHLNARYQQQLQSVCTV